MSKTQALSLEQATGKINLIAKDGIIRYSHHARKESMANRDVTHQDVLHLLKNGEVRSLAEWDEQYQNWKYKVEGEDLSKEELRVITIIFDSSFSLYVITVF